MSTLESHYLQLQQFLSQPTADTRLLSRLLNSHPDASRQTHLLYQKLYLYLYKTRLLSLSELSDNVKTANTVTELYTALETEKAKQQKIHMKLTSP